MIHRKWSLLTGPAAILGSIVATVIVANYLFVENVDVWEKNIEFHHKVQRKLKSLFKYEPKAYIFPLLCYFIGSGVAVLQKDPFLKREPRKQDRDPSTK